MPFPAGADGGPTINVPGGTESRSSNAFDTWVLVAWQPEGGADVICWTWLLMASLVRVTGPYCARLEGIPNLKTAI